MRAAFMRATISRRVHRHYRGFAANQLKLLEKEPTIKKLLYVLRTALTGTHLLRSGELETNLALADAYELREVSELVAAKRAGERTAIEPELLAEWRPKVEGVLGRLEAALERSVLPEEPRRAGEAALEAWLLAVRKSRFS